MCATTLTEYSSYRFLRERLEAVAAIVGEAPDRTVLWVGSGLSAKFGRLPTWQSFLEALLTENEPEIGGDDGSLIRGLIRSGRLAIAAECLQDRLGERVLTRIAATFADAQASVADIISPLCPSELITTNYDTILERSLPGYQVISPYEDMERLLAPGFKIVKIHGSADRPSTCVLTLSSYVRAYNVNLRWYLTNVFSSYTVLFIGASMNAAEPFFRPLRVLRSAARKHPRHFALLAVADEAAGKREGKRLASLGVDLLPYIPDATHSFVDEFLFHLTAATRTRASSLARIAIARRFVQTGALREAAVILWHLAIPHESEADRVALGDLSSTFFSAALARPEPLQEFAANGTALDELWLRLLGSIEPTRKALNGVEAALRTMQRVFGKALSGHDAVLERFKKRVVH